MKFLTTLQLPDLAMKFLTWSSAAQSVNEVFNDQLSVVGDDAFWVKLDALWNPSPPVSLTLSLSGHNVDKQ
jgi:hypothetical protein